MTDKTTLLPCPFCGGIANVMQDGHYPKWYVGCNDDNCLGFSGLGWLYGSKQQAIEAWNTRYEPTCALEINTDMSAIRCSKCGYEVPKGTVLQDVKFCMNCRAKVIEE